MHFHSDLEFKRFNPLLGLYAASSSLSSPVLHLSFAISVSSRCKRLTAFVRKKKRKYSALKYVSGRYWTCGKTGLIFFSP